jgi:hypothetical protein
MRNFNCNRLVKYVGKIGVQLTSLGLSDIEVRTDQKKVEHQKFINLFVSCVSYRNPLCNHLFEISFQPWLVLLVEVCSSASGHGEKQILTENTSCQHISGYGPLYNGTDFRGLQVILGYRLLQLPT